VRVSDAHIHFFSHRFFELLAAAADIHSKDTLTARLYGWELPTPDPTALADVWIDELDRNQVEHAALIATIPGDESSVAAAVRRGAGRFVGYFMFNPVAPDALETLQRSLDSGLRCAAFFPAMHGYEMTDPRVAGAIRILDEWKPGRTAAFVHCGLLKVGVRKRVGLSSNFDLRLSNPVSIHGLALRHPNLPFIIPHFGAGYFREALMVASSSPNVYLDTSSSNEWMAIEGLTLEQVFARTLSVVGAKRLLFGTDSSFFPRGWNGSIFDAQTRVMDHLKVAEDDVERIFCDNFRELFAIG
jgi:hypothetical protein